MVAACLWFKYSCNLCHTFRAADHDPAAAPFAFQGYVCCKCVVTSTEHVTGNKHFSHHARVHAEERRLCACELRQVPWLIHVSYQGSSNVSLRMSIVQLPLGVVGMAACLSVVVRPRSPIYKVAVIIVRTVISHGACATEATTVG